MNFITNKKSVICSLFILAFIHSFIFSQDLIQSHPSIEPLFLLEDVTDSSANEAAVLSADEIFKFSLMFSECTLDSEEGKLCLEQFEQIKKKVATQEYMNLEPADRGRAVLKLLYQDFLTTYDFNQTKINVALQTGVYNCVSSALLYTAAAKAAGLEVRGQKTSEHAFCTVYIPGTKAGQFTKIDVETTNPYGFNPGSKETIENEDKIYWCNTRGYW